MDTCQIDGCDKPRYQQRLLCSTHAMRKHRYGDPLCAPPTRYVDLTGQVFGTLTVVERRGDKWLCTCTCGGQRLTGLSQLNQQKARDSSITCGSRAGHRDPNPSYSSQHYWNRRIRGKASTYPCSECGQPAKQWAFRGECSDMRMSDAGARGPLAYCPHVEHYDPLCVPCHRVRDAQPQPLK